MTSTLRVDSGDKHVRVRRFETVEENGKPLEVELASYTIEPHNMIQIYFYGKQRVEVTELCE